MQVLTCGDTCSLCSHLYGVRKTYREGKYSYCFYLGMNANNLITRLPHTMLNRYRYACVYLEKLLHHNKPPVYRMIESSPICRELFERVIKLLNRGYIFGT